MSGDGGTTGSLLDAHWLVLVGTVQRFHLKSSITSNQIQIRAAWHSALDGFDTLVANVGWSKILCKTVDKSPMTVS